MVILNTPKTRISYRRYDYSSGEFFAATFISRSLHSLNVAAGSRGRSCRFSVPRALLIVAFHARNRMMQALLPCRVRPPGTRGIAATHE